MNRLATAVILMLAFFAGRMRSPAQPGWTANDTMLTYFGAIRALHDEALQEKTLAEWMRASLHALMEREDPYGEYLEPEEHRLLQEAQRLIYGGIGVELRLSEGGVWCVPYPDGPAEKAGLREGDRLVAVDGRPVEDVPVRTVASWIRGAHQSPVTLHLLRPGGETPVELPVLRSRVKSRTVRMVEDAGEVRLRIYAFEPSTPKEIEEVVSFFPPDAPIVLDLRGNQGGGLFEAVDAARLFLPGNADMLTIRRKDGERTYRAEQDGPFAARAVLLLQDGGTASSAEVFIAALTGNGRAISRGATTFGKGLTQQILPLMDGGALVVTDGALSGPGGLVWDQVGLPPSEEAPARTGLEEDGGGDGDGGM